MKRRQDKRVPVNVTVGTQVDDDLRLIIFRIISANFMWIPVRFVECAKDRVIST